MNLKLLLAIMSFGVFLFHFIRWRKTGFQFAGNEIILLPLVFSILSVIPGSLHITTLRLSAFSSVTALYILFESMRKRRGNVHWPLFVYALFVIFCYEMAFVAAGCAEESLEKWYRVANLFLWALSCGWFYWYSGKEENMKQTLSIQKVSAHARGFMLLTVLSGTIFYIECRFPYIGVLQCVFVSLLFVSNIWLGIQCVKPDYMGARHGNGGVMYGRKQFVPENACTDGNIIGDEGVDIADEGIVEDSRIIHSLMELFEKEKLYLNADVKIANVALMIGTNKTYLSRALNTRLSKNFCQFVNYYRIREVCALYVDNPDMEIKELAEQCGFNSSSNFSIVFKYNTGFSPGDWCRVVRQKLEKNETIFVDDYIL